MPVVGESTRVAPPFDGWRSAGAAAVGGKLPKQKVAAGFHFLCEGGRLLIEEGCSQKRTRLSGDIIGRGDCSAL